MLEQIITARIRHIAQEDIGIFRVELTAAALANPREFDVVDHPIQFKLDTKEWVMNDCFNPWGIGIPNVCEGQEIQLPCGAKPNSKRSLRRVWQHRSG
jgi:hypothetical protein